MKDTKLRAILLALLISTSVQAKEWHSPMVTEEPGIINFNGPGFFFERPEVVDPIEISRAEYVALLDVVDAAKSGEKKWLTHALKKWESLK